MSNNKAVNEMVDLFRDITVQEIKKMDTTILCKVAEKVGGSRYNLFLVPDETAVVRNVPNMTKFEPNIGDYVYVYKINNQLSNAFICCVLGATSDEIEDSGSVTTVLSVSESGGTVSSNAYVEGSVLHV